jgi:hypothetical protein
MQMVDRIQTMLLRARSADRLFPATIIYNEGWLLRLMLDWFSQQTNIGHSLDFEAGSKWFSEALLPSQFLARTKGDRLAEGWTHADGVIGHVTIGDRALANTSLSPEATQFVVLEAKLFSRLSPRVTNAADYDQAARNMACMAQVLCLANRQPERLPALGFYVIAPREQINLKLFEAQLSKASIQTKVAARVLQYAASDAQKTKEKWFGDWFLPTLHQAEVECFAWENLIEEMRTRDADFGLAFSEFYSDCVQFNRIQEPDLVTR